MLTALVLVFGAAFVLAACGGADGGSRGEDDGTNPGSPSGTASPDSPDTSVTVTSTAFRDGEPIPQSYSCKGRNVPPPLAWSGVPDDATELALVVDDPDAVSGRYVHWVVTGIDPKVTASPEGGAPPGGTVHPNSGGDRRYLGPCPPAGTGVHHYRFTVYVLDSHLDLDPDMSADRATELIADSARAHGRLVGLYRG